MWQQTKQLVILGVFLTLTKLFWEPAHKRYLAVKEKYPNLDEHCGGKLLPDGNGFKCVKCGTHWSHNAPWGCISTSSPEMIEFEKSFWGKCLT